MLVHVNEMIYLNNYDMLWRLNYLHRLQQVVLNQSLPNRNRFINRYSNNRHYLWLVL